MSRLLIYLFLILLASTLAQTNLNSQIIDDFSDGNFTENPAWQGEISEFIVNAAGELQLKAPDAGNSVLAVEGNIPDSAQWLLDFRLEFAPSTSNLLRIYLLADQADLLQANGYYFEIGENGSADALRFYRQDGATRSLLSTGIAGMVANDPVKIRLRVTRGPAGIWNLEAAANGGAFQPQGTVQDMTYANGPARFFGFYCLYTATRVDKFYFDNISIQEVTPDVQAPVLLGAQATSGTEVLVSFNEALDSTSALETAHYSIAGIGSPTAAAFSGTARQQVRLTLGTALGTGTYTLNTEQIADTSGNVSSLQSANFQYVNIVQAAVFDILINEIMADPSPSVGLPDVEWLELYNRSSKTIDLKTLLLSDGGTPQALPTYLLSPDSFVVLTTTSGAAALAPVTPRVLGMAGIPSLNNDGDALVLTNSNGQIIDQVTYSSSWHATTVKRDGGWTLERINPGLPCLGGENWQSCPVLPGGTPGLANASLQTSADTEPPRLVAAFPDNAFTLRLFFSEGLDQQAAAKLSAYKIEPPRALAGAQPSATDRREVLLNLLEPLSTGVVYAVTATMDLQDCSGNAAGTTDTAFVGLPEMPEPLDIVINEILFNPSTGGSDFVELYNRSNKIFNWQHFFLANFSSGSDVKALALDRLFLPGQYAVFSANTADIQSRFTQVQAKFLYQRTLPSLPDKEGNITLFWAKDGTVISLDSFDYVDAMHNALFSSTEREGVSLERIRPEGPTNDAANWTSAARSSFSSGTPTRPNSQRINPSSGRELIQLDPARISPDNDGYEDFLNIQYALPGTGYAATMTIFDANGIPVKRLVRQELIGTEGALRWDGDTDDGSLARPGIYILFIEVFSPVGDVQQMKQAFSVVRRF